MSSAATATPLAAWKILRHGCAPLVRATSGSISAVELPRSLATIRFVRPLPATPSGPDHAGRDPKARDRLHQRSPEKRVALRAHGRSSFRGRMFGERSGILRPGAVVRPAGLRPALFGAESTDSRGDEAENKTHSGPARRGLAARGGARDRAQPRSGPRGAGGRHRTSIRAACGRFSVLREYGLRVADSDPVTLTFGLRWLMLAVLCAGAAWVLSGLVGRWGRSWGAVPAPSPTPRPGVDPHVA